MTQVKESITYEDFTKVDIRVGVIVSAEEIPKAKKLLKLSVDFGDEIGVRTIVAGIAKHFVPIDLTGSNILAVVNLEPRSIMGIESHGMIMAAHGKEDKLLLATCCAIPISSGSVVLGADVG